MGVKDQSKTLNFKTRYGEEGKPPTLSNIVYANVGLKRTVGNERAHWQQNIADGVSATNSLLAERVKVTRDNDYCSVSIWGKNLQTRTFYVDGSPVPQLSFTKSFGTTASDAKNKALINILKKIDNASSSYGGPQFLAEFHQVVHQVRHPLESIQKLTAQYVKDLAKLKQPLKSVSHGSNRRRGPRGQDLARIRPTTMRQAVAGTYLEWVFGVKPFIQDINDIMSAATKLCSEPKIIRLSAQGTASKGTAATPQETAMGSLKWKYSLSKRVHSTEGRYVVGLKVANTSHQGLTERVISRGGFDLAKFVPTAWELLPWSFLIDYFSNVGDVLQTVMVNTANVAWVSYTEIQRELVETVVQDLDAKYTANSFGAGYTSWSSSGNSFYSQSLEYVRMSRDSSALGKPTLRFEFPGSSTKFINMAALFIQCSKTVGPQRLK